MSLGFGDTHNRPGLCGQLSSDKNTKFQWGKRKTFQQMVPRPLDSHMTLLSHDVYNKLTPSGA